MQPFAASVSSDSQRSDCENAVAERTQPGAAWKSSSASSVAAPPRVPADHASLGMARKGSVAKEA